MWQRQFGKAPAGERRARIRRSPHFRKGKFRNTRITSPLAGGASLLKAFFRALKHNARRFPPRALPTRKMDLRGLDTAADVLVWFGHSSYFLRVSGLSILVDPVFSGRASPFPGLGHAFTGTDLYGVADLPPIDYLLITHDHFDHLDYATVSALEPHVQHVVCGLGVGAHFEYWGYPAAKLREQDWHEQLPLGEGTVLYTEPATHQSGRGLAYGKTLWVSYVLKTPHLTLYLGGDSGYDQTQFVTLGQQYGPFDLVILENGQYEPSWRYHMLPEQTLQAAVDLRAKRLLPVHSSKFCLSTHPWDEPLRRLTRASESAGLALVTPLLGEVVDLRAPSLTFTPWWQGLP